ncbi:MAG TPA: hypothetical protein VFE98_07730 [Candidatus Bathyarchaeia archaeon]|nr:hypothetical protein [Candidatus Bathyarchaeia archaeon]
MRILLSQAREMVRKDVQLSKRYVQLARKISMRTKVRIDREEKQYLCKNCGIILIPGLNARIRLRPRNVRLVTCLSCGAMKRYPFSTAKREKNSASPMNPYIAPASGSREKKSALNEGVT